MKEYRSFFWLNSIALLLIVVLVLYTQSVGLPTRELFLRPESHPRITTSALTRLFQILCAVPPVVCLFSFGLLKTLRGDQQSDRSSLATMRFIFCSALVTGGFLLNEIYRIHVFLAIGGIPKPMTIMVYGSCFLLYLVTFRRKIRSTPYALLLIAMGILLVGIAIDALHLKNPFTSDFLEGIPKLLSATNIVLYFWLVCSQEVMKAFRNSAASIYG